MGPYFVAIDFDGTVTDTDIIDAVLQKFAKPEWQAVERLWEQGVIGSRECLERQISMIEQPLDLLLDFIDGYSIDKTFGDFVCFLRSQQIPFAIVSDGFQVFIRRLLLNAGLKDIPVFANLLLEQKGKLKTLFPYIDSICDSANCKCMAVSELSKDKSLILIGDGRSDFCLASKAHHVFSTKKLTGYCRQNKIPHTAFVGFAGIQNFFNNKGIRTKSLHSVASGKD